MSEKMLFIRNGNALKSSEAAKYPIMAAGLVAENVTHVFETEEAFDEWAKSTSYAERIHSVTSKIKEAKQYEMTDMSAIRDRKQKVINRIDEDMKELAGRTGLDPVSEELFLKATSDSSVLEGPIFDPITAFDFVGTGGFTGRGGWIHLPGGPWPDLGWFGWDDRMSSVRISGLAILCEHRWWGGRRILLGGFPIYFYSNLGIFGFNNQISSAWVA